MVIPELTNGNIGFWNWGGTLDTNQCPLGVQASAKRISKYKYERLCWSHCYNHHTVVCLRPLFMNLSRGILRYLNINLLSCWFSGKILCITNNSDKNAVFIKWPLINKLHKVVYWLVLLLSPDTWRLPTSHCCQSNEIYREIPTYYSRFLLFCLLNCS